MPFYFKQITIVNDHFLFFFFENHRSNHITDSLSPISTLGMIGYGIAKAAVHQLVKSLAGENSGIPANSTVLATLP